MLTMIENQVFALCPLKPLQLGFDIRYCRLPLQVRCTMPTGSLLVSWVQADALANYKSLDDIMSVTRYIFVMMMMTTLLGMALGCLLAWCCCCPRPCVDAVRPALASTQGTMRAHRLWLISRWTLWRFFVSGGKFIVGTGSATFSGRYLWLGLRWWSCKICG